jgi:hypothetical protein
MDAGVLREWATDAIRYREQPRIIYNLVLTVVVVLCFWVRLPASRAMVSVNFLLLLFMLAVLANVAYCAAYAVDMFAQASGFRELWQRYRWVLFGVGLAFAAAIARFWCLAAFAGRH